MVLEADPAFRAVMHGKTGRFIDHQHQPLAVKQQRHHRLGVHLFRVHAETAITGPAIATALEKCRTVRPKAQPPRPAKALMAKAIGGSGSPAGSSAVPRR